MAKQKPQNNNMMKQVQKMVVTGSGELRSVSISADVVDPDDIEMLEDLVVAAVTEAMRASQELQSEQMGPVTGGLDLSAFGLG